MKSDGQVPGAAQPKNDAPRMKFHGNKLAGRTMSHAIVFQFLFNQAVAVVVVLVQTGL